MKDLGLISDQPLLLHGTGVLGLTLFVIATPSTGLILQGGFADSGNYGPSSGYPTQPNMPPAGPRGPHGGMYQGGHPYY
ncbi:hypothetical protein Tco_0740221 [Tanacetum coccineum]